MRQRNYTWRVNRNWRIHFDNGMPLDSGWEHGEEHKSKNWTRWHRFSWQIVIISNRSSDLAGFRLWVYTRKNARSYDITFDRRKPEPPPEHFNCRSSLVPIEEQEKK